MYISCLFGALFVGVVSSLPWNNGYRHGPQRVVMMSGYYGSPISRRSHQYIPQGSISAFVDKDTVATNTYSGGSVNIPRGELPLEEHSGAEPYTEKPELLEFPTHEIEQDSPEVVPVQNTHLVGIDEVDASSGSEAGAEGESVIPTRPPKRNGRKKKAQKPVIQQEEDDEEEEDEIPNNRRYIPSNNVYFPISISGGSRNRARNGAPGEQEDEFFAPGSATAIANSYSTGKGGIATSHATSFGDPYLANMLYRSGFFNLNKAKKGTVEA